MLQTLSGLFRNCLSRNESELLKITAMRTIPLENPTIILLNLENRAGVLYRGLSQLSAHYLLKPIGGLWLYKVIYMLSTVYR